KQTAAKAGRPIFSAMLKALRANKADGVVMHKIDRSARNFRDWARIGELSDAGIDVHFATESLDFRSRGGRLSADIQAVIAADYIRNLREECIKGMWGRLKQGLYPFNAPIGYLDNGGGELKTHDPLKAELVSLAFDLYASGQHSLRSLQKEMDELGLRNKKGKPLSVHGIETMLGNPFYCGVMRVKTTGEVFDGKHEPLISVSIFDAVQRVRAGRCGKKVTRHNHNYRGLFRCGHCSAAMTPEKQKGHVYYRCQTRSCPTKTVREECIEKRVQSMFSTLALPEEYAAKLYQEVKLWIEKRGTTKTRKGYALQLSQIDERMAKLEDAAIEQIIDKDGFNKRKQELLLEKARLQEEQQRAAENRLTPDRVRQFLELLKSLAYSYEIAKPARKREFVQLFTSNRIVTGKNVYLEPVNWLMAAKNVLAVTAGDPHQHTSRRPQEVREQHIEEFIDILHSEKSDRLSGNLDFISD
ncbi:MAG: recombinase family protein, partial [Flavobacteriaceae bacterium]|nr:recombinase family protein [Flavobacteriaceae bacterium]